MAEAAEIEGWIEADGVGELDDRMFVAKVVGRSMEPRIHDGDYCVFRAHPAGSTQNKIVLARYRGPADPETGECFTVKRYSSEVVSEPEGRSLQRRVTLCPLHPDFKPNVVSTESEDGVQIVAEFLTALGRT